PALAATDEASVKADHPILGSYHLYCDRARPDSELPESAKPSGSSVAPTLLFTENDTNIERLYGAPNKSPYVKDGLNNYVVHGQTSAVNPEKVGTKMAAHYSVTVEPGRSVVVELRLAATNVKRHPQGAVPTTGDPFADFDSVFTQRLHEADEFYAALQSNVVGDEMKMIQRQALAGMLWSKQFYHYIVDQWLKGDPGQPPPRERKNGRNREWPHLYNERVMSMPDKWEYPWYAAWDLAFHCIPLAMVDPEFAKSQLDLMLREWYQHPNGQVPAYEWAFGDVNPPVLAWAAWRIYKMESKHFGVSDRMFLERVFHKLMINFTWWVNRKDSEGNNVFQGGFLGLDNIGVFDRSAPLPTGGHIEQSDGTSWMGMFSLNMMTMALELALANPVYEDIATKFFE
ncbi:MAG: glucosidase, partial [Chloroflexota bacterium]